jgi:hypothetical protein
MAQEETRVRSATGSTAAVGAGPGWQARLRRGWKNFLMALMRAMSAWVV